VVSLGGQPITKTVTLRADNPLIEVALDIAALPFMPGPPMRLFARGSLAHTFPRSLSLISADNGLIADLYRRDGQIEAVVLGADPRRPMAITSGGKQTKLPPAAFIVTPVELAYR